MRPWSTACGWEVNGRGTGPAQRIRDPSPARGHGPHTPPHAERVETPSPIGLYGCRVICSDVKDRTVWLAPSRPKRETKPSGGGPRRRGGRRRTRRKPPPAK